MGNQASSALGGRGLSAINEFLHFDEERFVKVSERTLPRPAFLTRFGLRVRTFNRIFLQAKACQNIRLVELKAEDMNARADHFAFAALSEYFYLTELECAGLQAGEFAVLLMSFMQALQPVEDQQSVQ